MADAQNNFSKFYTNLDSPGRNAFNITPSDTDELAFVTRAVFVGTGGDLSVVFEKDTVAVTFLNVPNGTWLPIMVKKVLDTNTDADNLVAVY